MKSKRGPTAAKTRTHKTPKTAAKARTRRATAKTGDSVAKDVKTIYKGILALAREGKDAPEAVPEHPFVKSINRWALAASTPTGAAASDSMRRTLKKLNRELSPAARKRAHQLVYAFQEDPTLLKNVTCAYKGTSTGCTRNCGFHKDSHVFSNPATLFAHTLNPGTRVAAEEREHAESGGSSASPKHSRKKHIVLH
jgi:hypothetical protein